MRVHLLLISLVFLARTVSTAAPPINPRLLDKYWTASWIECPQSDPTGYGVYHFRRSFDLDEVPGSLGVHVSADNRYKLWINGEEIGKGPARGDLANWPCESYNLAPFLKTGTNILAAQVWNAGPLRPVAQHSLRTAFVLQADQARYDGLLNTGADWRVLHNEGYTPVGPDHDTLQTYIVVGPGDRIEGDSFPWGWTETEFDDSNWQQPAVIEPARPPGLGTDIRWQLIPRSIPPMEEFHEPLGTVRRVTGLPDRADLEGTRQQKLTVPANSRVKLLFDRGQLTVGYPEVRTTGGAGASIRLTYAEALIDENRQKGNRDEIGGKSIIGLGDQFLPGGSEHETFTTLWIRTYRYLELDIRTGAEPLVLEDLSFRFSAYPFRQAATFFSSDPSLQDIWDVGWRTARLCAGETYFDCPYYEQLQYVGDTRIQALISLYVAGDDRLMRKAIRLFDQSRFHEGLTRSRYPSYDPQVIPPYSLFWINMVHDFLMHRPDLGFVRDRRMGIITVLDWYEQQTNPRGLVGETPYWNFVDWTDEWPWSPELRSGGVPDLAGGSSILSLQLVYALQDAAHVFEVLGEPFYRDQYLRWAERLRQSVLDHCWDADRGLFADTPAMQSYSQHANIWAVLTDTVTGDEAVDLMNKVMVDESLIQATFYFKFYLFQALYQTGLADRYLEQLQPWREMLELGLSTFAEKPDPTRSDCHAWSASPNYDFLATVCGIRPSSPGFATVSIEPHLGPLQEVEASMPHPAGEIRVRYKSIGGHLEGEVLLPEDVSGILKWRNAELPLHGGSNILDL